MYSLIQFVGAEFQVQDCREPEFATRKRVSGEIEFRILMYNLEYRYYSYLGTVFFTLPQVSLPFHMPRLLALTSWVSGHPKKAKD
jgi:hypothetical protein